MKNINNFWNLANWFTKSVNDITVYHDISEIQTRRFLYILADNYKKMRPANHGWLIRIDIDTLLERSFLDYTCGEKHPMSPDVKGAIVKVVKRHLFGFYPFTYKEVDRLMNLMYE